MYSVRDVCVVNAGVLETSLVDAFDHCLGEVEPAAGNGYIAEHGLKAAADASSKSAMALVGEKSGTNS